MSDPPSSTRENLNLPDERDVKSNDDLLPMIQMMFGTSTRPPPLSIPAALPEDNVTTQQDNEASEPVPYQLRPRSNIVYSK